MRKAVSPLLLILFCLLAWEHNAQGQTGAQSRPSALQRDIKLNRAVSGRYHKIGKRLQPEAKRKLALASRALLEEMVKSPEPRDLEKIARAEVNKQFIGLSAAQLDVTSFYVLADVAQNAKQLLDQRDSLSDLSQEQQLKMQMIMERMTKADTAASNLMKKLSETLDQIIGNIK